MLGYKLVNENEINVQEDWKTIVAAIPLTGLLVDIVVNQFNVRKNLNTVLLPLITVLVGVQVYTYFLAFAFLSLFY